MKEFFNLRDKFKKTELSRIIFLTNSDFKKGTYRITKPGHYKIKFLVPMKIYILLKLH